MDQPDRVTPDRDAFERLIEEYADRIYNLALRITGNRADAEDSMQEAFLSAYRAWSTFRGHSSRSTWLYRIAVNEALTLLRRRGGAPVPMDESLLIPVPDGCGAVAERLAVQSALARVRQDHRAILVLRFWEDLSYEEIAEVLGISLPVMKMRLKRAKEEFRTWYEDAQ